MSAPLRCPSVPFRRRGQFLESAEVHGNLYGTSFRAIEETPGWFPGKGGGDPEEPKEWNRRGWLGWVGLNVLVFLGGGESEDDDMDGAQSAIPITFVSWSVLHL